MSVAEEKVGGDLDGVVPGVLVDFPFCGRCSEEFLEQLGRDGGRHGNRGLGVGVGLGWRRRLMGESGLAEPTRFETRAEPHVGHLRSEIGDETDAPF